MGRSTWQPGQSPLSAKVASDSTLIEQFERELARRWHAQSDHILADVGLGDEGCTCLTVGRRLRTLVAALIAEPAQEPPGLGTVVCNPLTGGVWVRGTDVRLYKRESAVPDQDWIEPYGDGWYSWRELPRPLIMLSEGWALPT